MAKPLYEMYDGNQFGFLPKSSTACSIISLLHHIYSNIDLHPEKKNYILSLDIAKAFDNVNHDKLISILSNSNLNTNFVCLVSNYLSNRFQAVKLGSTISPVLPVSSGVPQGSILGPILFNIYVNGLGPSNNSIKCFKYADDTCFLISIDPKENLEDCINAEIKHVKAWCNNQNMFLNENKTKILPICKFSKNCNMELTNSNLSCYFDKSLTYLGFNISCDLKWSNHIDKIIKTISSRLHILRTVKSILNKKQLIIIYIGLIQSILNYSFPIHTYFTSKDIKRLTSLRRRAHNIICNVNCHEDCLPCFSTKWNDLSKKLFSNIVSNENHILHKILLSKSIRSGRFLLNTMISNGLLNSFIVQNSLLFNEGRK